ncbi:hypothetical protein [Rubrivivax rivuli]|uniref:Uncharacterized protein n=1 Tax=Rubrivivax rivuli TaxID=1862385 RepID=A0A437REE4_9BURK|nr:hypothetical protein [Rubrivivax rivuli]RVU45119.1 hypothetical protein EOE66_13255 [Rubrivivax rivuli]
MTRLRTFHHRPDAAPAAAGLVLLALAVLLAAWAAPRWRAEAEAARARHRAAQAQAVDEAVREAVRQHERQQAAKAETLPHWPWPDAAASPRRAAALDLLARRQGLQLLQVRQQLDAAQHWQVSMVGSGAYGDIRRFVERALAADPALALDRLRLQRDDADTPVLRFELQWSLLHHPAPRSAGATEAAPGPAKAPPP